MPANKFATIRYHVIDKMLRNKYRPYPSVEDIMNKCSDVLLKPISKSSIEKDIRAMKNDEALGYFAPIEFSRTHRGYYYSNLEYSIDKVPLNEDEIEAVQFATNILTQFKNVAIFKDYENAIEKVLDKVNLTSADGPSETQFIQFENIPTVSGNEHLAPILNSIRKKTLIKFNYQSFKSDTISDRTVEPYLLKEHKNRWYLIGMESGADIYKVFGLERMLEVKITNTEFRRLPNFVAEEFFKNSIGITANPNIKPEKIILECNKVLIQYLDSQPIHSSQNIEITKDGGIVELELIITFELLQLLSGWGSEVKVIEPENLITELKKHHLDAVKHYS
ncbi:MAG: helix-turn-helix transcriptional regulator [Salibacteraceae bacterium]